MGGCGCEAKSSGLLPWQHQGEEDRGGRDEVSVGGEERVRGGGGGKLRWREVVFNEEVKFGGEGGGGLSGCECVDAAERCRTEGT